MPRRAVSIDEVIEEMRAGLVESWNMRPSTAGSTIETSRLRGGRRSGVARQKRVEGVDIAKIHGNTDDDNGNTENQSERSTCGGMMAGTC